MPILYFICPKLKRYILTVFFRSYVSQLTSKKEFSFTLLIVIKLVYLKNTIKLNMNF